MKKNFFKKKLASALAIALVVASVYPAGVTASAAAALKIVDNGATKATSTLYVGSKVNYDLSKQVTGTKYTWTISNSKVATIASNSGVVVAKAPGVVTVKVTAKPKTGAAKVYSTKLTVKQRATSVEAGEDVTVALGETVQLKAVKTPATSTDAVRYFTGDKNIATVKSTTGVVTPVAVGETTITVYSKANASVVNGSKGNKSDTVKVKVINTILTAKQTAANQVVLTFGGAVKDLKATDFVIENNDDTHVILAVKDIAYSTDGKTVTLTTFANFADKASYKVTYAEKALTFSTTIGEAASVELPDTIEAGKEVAITPVFKNAEGVDISSLITTSTLSVEVVNGYYDSVNKKLYLLNAGDTAKVTVTLPASKWDANYKPLNGLELTKTITAVPANAVAVLPFKYTIYDTTADFTKTAVTSIAVGDSAKKIAIEVKKADKTDISANFTFSSSDNNTLIVNGNQLIALKAGNVYVLATSTVDKLQYSLLVNVLAERKATGVALDKTSVVVSNGVNDDPAEFNLTVKDQYGSNLDVTAVTVGTPYSQPTGGNFPAAAVVTNGKTATFDVNTTPVVPGTYVLPLKVSTAKGDVAANVTVVVKKPDLTSANTSYALTLSKATVDTTIKSTTTLADLPVINIKVGKYYDGVLGGYASSSDITSLKVTGPDGTALANVNAVNPKVEAAFVSGSSIQKIKTGTYKVEATVAGKTYTQFFTVTDAQTGPVLTAVKDVVTTKTNLSDIVDELFTIKQDTTTYTSTNISKITTNPVITGSVTPGTTVYFDKVTVELPTGILNTTLSYDVVIGKSVYVKQP